MKIEHIDPYLVQQDIRNIEAEIAKVKAPLRTTWTKPMGREQFDLLRLRAEATDLYILRAWMRGKLHRTNPPEATRALLLSEGRDLSEWDAREHAQEVAERMASRYAPQPSDSEPKTPFWKRLLGRGSTNATDGV